MRSRHRDERGAVAVVVAAIALVLVLIAAFAVDLGMQRVARRDMQSLADVVALDLVRELDGARTVDQLTPLMPDLARESQKRNESTIGETPDLHVELGRLDAAGDFEVMTGAAIPSAVRVAAGTSIGFAFVPGSGGATRSAVAQAEATACFRVGTFALGLATEDSALNGLLGNALGIGVLGYDGLATSSIGLLGLAAELGVGTPEELVALDTLTLGQLIAASADVLAEESPGDANIAVLNAIKTQLDLEGLSGQVIDLGELVDLGTGRGSGLDASLNLLDLVSGAAFLSNGDAAIAIPDLALSVPGVADLDASLSVIQAPRQACGDGVARTGQFELTLTGDLAVGVCPSGLLSLVVKVCVGGPIEVTLGLAEAEGRLAGVTCKDGAAESISVRVSRQALASTRIALGSPDPLGVKASLLGIGLVNLNLVNLVADVTQADFANSYLLKPWDSYVDTPFHTPQTPVSVPDLTVSQLGVAGLNLDWLLSPVLGLLNPVIGALNTLISGVLSPALGLKVAGVDIWAGDDPAPSCAVPRLVG